MNIVTSVLNSPKSNEKIYIVNNTIKEHQKKYGNNYVPKKLIMIFRIQFFDKIRNKTKIISTKRGV